MTKTCGECKHYIAEMFHCQKNDVMAEVHNTCEDFASKAPPTNGEKIITGGIKALVKFHILDICDTCTYYNKEHTSHNDICLCPPGKTCADGIEEWLNAPAEIGVGK